MSASPVFLGFVTDDASHKVLGQFTASKGWDVSHAQKGDVDAAVAYLASHPSPDFLLVEVKNAAEAPAALDKLADVCANHVKVIVTSTVDEFSFFRWLKDIGIHHYLLKPLTLETLADAITQKPEAEKVQLAPKQGSLTAVIGTRGGVGASTLALELAAACGTVLGINTMLLDLEPHWGTISLMMDLEPGRGLRDAFAKPDRVDSLFMERVMLKYAPNLSVLSSEEPLDEPINIHGDAAASLLRESRQKFNAVIADLPRAITPFTQDILKAADHVLVATELTLVSLRDAMRLQDFLKGKLGLSQVHFVATRQGMLSKLEMPAMDFEKTLQTKFAGILPFDGDYYRNMTSGTLAVDKKAAAPLAKAVIELARTLHASADKEEKAKPTRKLSWLTKAKRQ